MNFISIKNLIKETKNAYADNFFRLYLISLVGLLPITLIPTLLPKNTAPLSQLLIAISSFILLLAAQLALYFAAQLGTTVGVIQLFGMAFKKVYSYFWLSLLVGVLTVLGFLIFVVPGIIFALWYGLSIPVLVSENLKGTKAMIQSREYVRGFAWALFRRYFLFGLVVVAITFIIERIVSMLPERLGLVISPFFYALMLPATTLFTYRIYLALKNEKGLLSPETSNKKRWLILSIFSLAVLGGLAISVYVGLHPELMER